ncbi:MAG: arylamine N-acetyltransferase, partial [Bacteroidota bacterium]
LVDVGFGSDSFVFPKELKLNVLQKDVHDYYQFEEYNDKEWLLLQSTDGIHFSRQYIFSFDPQPLSNFAAECQRKQTVEGTHFKDNLICTKATPEGRISIYNDRLTIKTQAGKEFMSIENEAMLLDILAVEFGLIMPIKSPPSSTSLAEINK